MLMDLEPDHGQRPRGPLWSALLGRQLRLWADRRRQQLGKWTLHDSAKLIDLVLDMVPAGPFGQPFRPNNFVLGQTGAGNI